MDPSVTEEQLAAHLAPDNLRLLLQLSGLYLVGYELLKTTIVSNVSGFFLTGFDESGLTYSTEYDEIRSGHRHELDGCLQWLVDESILSQAEVEAVTLLRDERNRVGHELPSLLVDPSSTLDVGALLNAQVVLKKVAVFFGGIEADLLPDNDGAEVDYEGIESVGSWLYSELLDAFAAAEDDLAPDPTPPPAEPA